MVRVNNTAAKIFNSDCNSYFYSVVTFGELSSKYRVGDLICLKKVTSCNGVVANSFITAIIIIISSVLIYVGLRFFSKNIPVQIKQRVRKNNSSYRPVYQFDKLILKPEIRNFLVQK